MNADATLEDHIRTLEERLLRPEVRASSEELGRLLAEDFFEFGSSGQVFTKQDVIGALKDESERHFTIEAFRAQTLGPGVVLATYRAIRCVRPRGEPAYSLRSSIWRFEEGGWRLVFHQGTPTESG